MSETDLLAKVISQSKTIKSYESAIEKLKERRESERREKKAKDKIVEQYLQQTKKDQENEL